MADNSESGQEAKIEHAPVPIDRSEAQAESGETSAAKADADILTETAEERPRIEDDGTKAAGESQSHLEVDAHMEALEQGPRRYYRSQFKKQPLYSKEQLPILFPGYAPDRMLMFSRMFAPKREIRNYRKESSQPLAKTADTAAHDLGDDEDAVFVDYVPPRPVILRLRPHGAQEAQEPGPTATETVAKRAPSVGSMSVDEIELRVEEARKDDGADASLVPGTLLPFTQVDWEESIGWGHDGDDESESGEADATPSNDKLVAWRESVGDGAGLLSSDSDDDDLLLTPPEPSQQPDAAGDGERPEGIAGTTGTQHKDAEPQPGMPRGRIDMIYDNLLYGPWDLSIVWDDAVPPEHPIPNYVFLDMNDPTLLFDRDEGLPELPTYQKEKEEEEPEDKKTKKKDQAAAADKKAKPLTKAEQWQRAVRLFHKQLNDNNEDIFNLSNDKVSAASRVQQTVAKEGFQHSLPADRLMEPFFRTWLPKRTLRLWHRPHLKPVPPGDHVVMPLTKYIRKKNNERKEERDKSGGGDIFFMKKVRDLSAKDGDLVLLEFSEEYPPLVSNVGMATKFVNFFKKHELKQGPSFKHGAAAIQLQKNDSTHQMFLGNMQPGQSLQSIENKLYRAPVFKHKPAPTDFLIIRSKGRYYIREIPHIYTVGQTLPKVEVVPPGSRKGNSFLNKRLEVHILRMYRNQKDKEKKIRFEDIHAAFPNQSETSIRKKLKSMADFKRGGNDSGWWVLKSGYRLPSDEDLRGMLTPEEVCAYESGLAAYQRLRDAGYRVSRMALSDIKEEEEATEAGTAIFDDEKLAPWNSTRNFVDAMAGKCQLAVTGPGDPTGRGSGYSFVRAPNKPVALRHDNPIPRKKVTEDPNADLRKLPLKEAKALLREKFGVSDADIPAARWDVINLVREMSSKSARGGDSMFSKFARGTRISFQEHHQKYLNQCQRVFEKQCDELGSVADLASDDALSDESETEEALEKDMEALMETDEGSAEQRPTKHRVLRIVRTYKGEDGVTYKVPELVRDERVIQMYVDQTANRQALLATREATAKKKRAQRSLSDDDMGSPRPGRPRKSKKDTTKRCSACKQYGHVRNNRSCPMYGTKRRKRGSSEESEDIDVEESEEEEAEYDGDEGEDDEDDFDEMFAEPTQPAVMVNVDQGNRLVMRIRKPIDEADEIARQNEADQALMRNLAQRGRRQTPLVVLNDQFIALIDELFTHPESHEFQQKVDKRLYPDYYKVVKHPIDLGTMKEKAKKTEYRSRHEFMADMSLMADNCMQFNGGTSVIFAYVQKLVQLAEEYIAEHDDVISPNELLV